jgi:hypothetical protein
MKFLSKNNSKVLYITRGGGGGGGDVNSGDLHF